MYSLFIGPLVEGTFYYTPDYDDKEAYEHFPLVLQFTKFMCALILHITVQPKVNEALERLRYIHRHPHKFERITVPLFICYLKLIVEITLEIESMLITATMVLTIEVVLNYIALIVISELDEIYYDQVRSKLKEEFEERELEVPIRNMENLRIHQGLHWWDRVLLWTIDFIYLGYDVFYFHFFPYVIFLVLLLWKNVTIYDDIDNSANTDHTEQALLSIPNTPGPLNAF